MQNNNVTNFSSKKSSQQARHVLVSDGIVELIDSIHANRRVLEPLLSTFVDCEVFGLFYNPNASDPVVFPAWFASPKQCGKDRFAVISHVLPIFKHYQTGYPYRMAEIADNIDAEGFNLPQIMRKHNEASLTRLQCCTLFYSHKDQHTTELLKYDIPNRHNVQFSRT